MASPGVGIFQAEGQTEGGRELSVRATVMVGKHPSDAKMNGVTAHAVSYLLLSG